MAKKTASSRPRNAGAPRTTAARKKTTGALSRRKKTIGSKTASAHGSVKKHVGDVLGLSRARVSKSVPGGGRRPKGIEIMTTPRRRGMKRARVVGGVRGRG